MNQSNRTLNICAAVFMALCLIFGSRVVQVARADSVPQPIPLYLDWTDTSLITTANDWSGVPGVVGYLGDNLGSKAAGVNPQNILVDGTDTTMILTPNLTNPNSIGSAGVVEFEIDDPTIGLSGSNAPHAPFLLIHLDTRAMTDITISYDVRDLESTKQDAVQQVALHYRVGSSGNFTNLPAAYVADATEPYTASKITHVSALLPMAAENQPLVQLRIMTANAIGKDEWIGIDNIVIAGVPMPDVAPAVSSVTPAPEAVAVAVDGNITVTFSEPVTLADGWFSLECARSGPHTVTITETGAQTYTLDPLVNFARGETCSALILADHVSDLDLIPPVNLAADYAWNFTSANTPPASTLDCYNWAEQTFTGRQQEFVLALGNPAASPTIPHARLQFTFAGGEAGDIAEMAVFDPLLQVWVALPLTLEADGLTAYYGPETGFMVPGAYTSAKLFRLSFAKPGSYSMTVKWLDLDFNPAASLATLNESITVKTQVFLPLIRR